MDDRHWELMVSALAVTAPATPPGLADRIEAVLANRRARAARVRLAAYGIATVGSIVALWLAGTAFVAAATAASFPQLFSLVFTDFQSVVANAGSYALSLIEAFPVVPFAVVLAAALALVTAVTAEARQVRGAGGSRRHRLTYA